MKSRLRRVASLASYLVLSLLSLSLQPAYVRAQDLRATSLANLVDSPSQLEAPRLRRRLQTNNCPGGNSPCSTTTSTTTSSTISVTSTATSTTSTSTTSTTSTITTTTVTTSTVTTTTTSTSTTTRTTSTTSAIADGTRYSVELEGYYIMVLDDPSGFVENSESQGALKSAIASLASVASSKVTVSLSLWSRRLSLDEDDIEDDFNVERRRLVDGNVKLNYYLSLSEKDGPEAQTHAQSIWEVMFQTSTSDLTSDFQFMVDGKVTSASYDLTVTLASAPARHFVQGTTTITTTTTTTAAARDASQTGDEVAQAADKSFKEGIIVALAVAISCCCLAMCAKFALGIHFSSSPDDGAIVYPEPPEAEKVVAEAPASVAIHVVDTDNRATQEIDPNSTLKPNLNLRSLASEGSDERHGGDHIEALAPR